MLECVRQMDEQLCMKASKISLMDLQFRVDEDHEFMHDATPKLNERLDETRDLIENGMFTLQGKLQEFEDGFSMSLNRKVM
jgi:hypothetical protein